jgi:hypothetical protein
MDPYAPLAPKKGPFVPRCIGEISANDALFQEQAATAVAAAASQVGWADSKPKHWLQLGRLTVCTCALFVMVDKLVFQPALSLRAMFQSAIYIFDA